MGGRTASGRGDDARLPIISNASPLIALERIGRRELLRELFGRVVIPPAVRRELGPDPLPEWIVERAFSHPIDRRVYAAQLDPGEREAIALALEIGVGRLLLDDRAGRRLAIALELPVSGTAGLLLTAKNAALLPQVRPSLEALRASGFHIGAEIVEVVLAKAGEK